MTDEKTPDKAVEFTDVMTKYNEVVVRYACIFGLTEEQAVACAAGLLIGFMITEYSPLLTAGASQAILEDNLDKRLAAIKQLTMEGMKLAQAGFFDQPDANTKVH